MNSYLSKNTQVVLVTFNPEIELLRKNLAALSKQFEHILLVDNYSKNISSIEIAIAELRISILVKKLDKNKGIAYAQNVGLKEAMDKKLKWLLTMDQDSIIPDNLSIEYQKIINKYSKIGLLAWMPKRRPSENEEIKNKCFIVGSGCLHNIDGLKACGGFDENLFIDHVDTDINMKLINLGYISIATSEVQLTHQLGTKTDKKTIRGNTYSSHTPDRVYYFVRNGVVLFKRYFFTHPFFAFKLIKNNIRESIYLLTFHSSKMKNLKLLLSAWHNGITNRLGKID